ncbi:MAG: type 4a pilus biogenesis protein PilO [Rubrobacteraceae bacterium]
MQRSEEQASREQQLQQLQQQVAELEEIARNAPEIERQLLELSKRIPTQPEIPTLVVQVEEVAREAGVTQVSIEPGAPEPPPQGGDFSRIPITMSFEGTYEQLQDFVGRVLNLVRLVTINEINYEVAAVEGEETVPEPGVERLLQVEIVAEVYLQSEDVPSGQEPVAPDPDDTTPEP